MPGVSLHEIKNKLGQLIVNAANNKPPMIGIPSDSPVVDNLNSHKLQNWTLQQILDALKQYTDSKDEALYNNVGHVDTINGVKADKSKDINLRALGDITIIPNPAENEVVICGHNGINGMVFVDFRGQFDGMQREFFLDVPSGYIDGPDLMIFDDGDLLLQGRDYTFDRSIAKLTFTEAHGAPTAMDNMLAFITRNGAVNMGIVRLVPISGAITGSNKKFVFNTDGLTNTNTMVWLNGMLAKPGTDYSADGGNSITFTNAPSANAFIEYCQLKPYGGLLTPMAMVGAIDGTNKVFSISDGDAVADNTFIWINGQLLNRYGPDFEVDPDTRTVILSQAPSVGAVIQPYKIAMESDIVSVNGVLPDSFQNITLRGGSGIEIIPNYQKHELTVNVTQSGGSGSSGQWVKEYFVAGNEPLTQLSLSETPVAGSEFVIRNGQILDSGEEGDYTISGQSINLNGSLGISEGEKITIRYQVIYQQ